MATPDSVPNVTTITADHPSGPSQEHYTGVVVIHGLGAIKRNTTLEEAVNTLAYWFNHKASLALRREGLGRVWVTAQLTDDPNPDAAAARASISLRAPGEPVASADDQAALRLEFREVWWAESFGLPSVGATIAWARVQAVEQATHLLLPIGRRLGPAQTARRIPAREIPQALTYRPSTAPDPEVAPLPRVSDEEEGAEDGAHTHFTRTQRFLLRGALGIYSLVQYVWKALQWLILTPLILLLLVVMGLVRVLVALIPPLQSTVIAGISAVLDTIMLHWVAEAQVYTLDYTRSAGIRERFEREVVDFLRDDACDRIVVIAHSMGTVIAYEGLTTVLERPEFHDGTKPVTFICLAQALRRIWLMTADDPHRVRGVLPDHVRWLHFWARYDPVAAGPLSARSLPKLDAWPDPTISDPYEALSDRLEGCENIDVVNTDSAFTDHTTYWENLEQVVGPVARELVAGYPVLEEVVQAHLATPDDVLLRRWQVAWRATVALVVGFGVGLALLIWGGSQGWTRVGQTLATSFLKFVADLLRAVASGFGAVTADLQQIINGLSGGNGPSIPVSVSIPETAAYEIWSIMAALVVAGVSILVIGRGIALRPPLAVAGRGPASRGRAWSLVVLSAAFLALLLAGSVVILWYGFGLVMIVAGLLCGLAALVLAIISTSRRRQRGWEAVILLLTAPVVPLTANVLLPNPVLGAYANGVYSDYVSLISLAALAGVVVGGAGGLLYLWVLARSRRYGSFTVLLLIELMLLYFVVAYVVTHVYAVTNGTEAVSPSLLLLYSIGFIIPFVGLFMPVFTYAIVTWVGPLGIRHAMPGQGKGLISLPIATVVVLNVTALAQALAFYSGYPGDTFQHVLEQVIHLGFGGVGLMSLLAVGWAGIHAVQSRRWGWLVALLLTVFVTICVVIFFYIVLFPFTYARMSLDSYVSLSVNI